MNLGKGTTFTWGGSAVAQLLNIGTPEVTVASIDSTTHDTSGRFREFMAGLADGGSIPITGYFDAADTSGQAAMYADAAAGITREVVITGPAGLFSLTMNCFITNIKPIGDAPIDGGLPFSATLKVTGAPVFAAGASSGMTAVAFSNSGALIPVFASGTYEYVVNFATGISSFTITPTAAGHTITVEANGASQTVTSGNASSAIALGAAGSMTTVVVNVQQSGKARKTYKFYCVRAAA